MYIIPKLRSKALNHPPPTPPGRGVLPPELPSLEGLGVGLRLVFDDFDRNFGMIICQLHRISAFNYDPVWLNSSRTPTTLTSQPYLFTNRCAVPSICRRYRPAGSARTSTSAEGPDTVCDSSSPRSRHHPRWCECAYPCAASTLN